MPKNDIPVFHHAKSVRSFARWSRAVLLGSTALSRAEGGLGKTRGERDCNSHDRRRLSPDCRRLNFYDFSPFSARHGAWFAQDKPSGVLDLLTDEQAAPVQPPTCSPPQAARGLHFSRERGSEGRKPTRKTLSFKQV